MSEPRPDRVEDLFHKAADLAPAARAAFLAEQCAADPDLRAAVEELLRHDPGEVEGADFLPSPVSPLRPLPPSSLSLPFSQLGHYRLLRKIGDGGMGAVYEAEQENPRRRVAVKVIRPGVASRGLVERFRREAQVLGRLHHPGIAQIYEAGLAADGQPFFAMELIVGPPLLDYAQQRLDSRDRLSLLARVCDAVQHAHEKGVIHRDLKPGNILVDETGQPKVLDFGVARATDADLLTTTGSTEVGQLLGTLAYMSPEQMAADPRLIDARVDVYALGVILFELLAQRLPYDLKHVPLVEAARVIRDQEPSRLGSINTLFRGDVETIAAKALAKEKERRYASAAALASDIRRYLNQEPILARPPSALYQLRKFARRNKALVGGVAGVLAALVLGMIGTTLFALGEAEQRRQAEHNAGVAHDKERAALLQAYRARIAAATVALEVHDVVEADRQLKDAPEPLRNWEWRHLRSRLDESAETIEPPAEGSVALARCREGIRLALVTPTDLRLLDEDRRERLALPVPAGQLVAGAGENRRGPWVAVVDANHTLYLLDQAGKVRLEGANLARDGLRGIVVSPDQTRLALVRFWQDPPGFEVYDVASAKPLASFQGHEKEVYHLVFSPDGKHIASGSEDGTARVWDVGTGATAAVFRGHKVKVHHVAFRPDGACVASTSADGTVRQWDPRTSEEVEPAYVRHTHEVRTAVYSPDGQWLASAGLDRTVRVWRATGDHEGVVRHGHTGSVSGLAFSADGRRLASVSADGSVRLWDVDPQTSLPVLRGHTQYVYPVAFSPDGQWIASGSWDHWIRLWDARTGEECARLPHANRVRALAFSPDSSWLVSACDDDVRMQIWDVATARRRRTIAGPGKGLQAVRVSPDGARVAALDREEGRGVLVDVATGEEVASFRVGKVFNRKALAYSPDGRWLAGVGEDRKTVCLWDARTLRPSAQLTGHTADVQTVDFSPDGCRLVSAGLDQTVRVWEVDTGACRDVLRQPDEVFTAVFHPDGTRIASAGRDGTIWLWDTASGQEMARLKGHTGYVFSLAFSPDGATLVSGSGDSTVRLWDTAPLKGRYQALREAEALRPEAERLVEQLFREKKEAAEVVAALQADGAASAPLRRAALRVVMRRGGE
jgi:eukaryotic-like serine/threonine-protein kinase